jgi:hypothetical protein
MKTFSYFLMAIAIAVFTVSCGSEGSDSDSDDKKEEKSEKTDKNCKDHQKDEACEDDIKEEKCDEESNEMSSDDEYVSVAFQEMCDCFDEIGVSTFEELSQVDGDAQASFDNCISELAETYPEMDAKIEAIGKGRAKELMMDIPCANIVKDMMQF